MVKTTTAAQLQRGSSFFMFHTTIFTPHTAVAIALRMVSVMAQS